ncbi:MAG: alpha/beta fold hydrolase [Candidatus Helarchaeota archaeon]|nr:alpha/beta fold hydrolase [Candidatus Helarchaeota archaeon]
MSAKEFFTSNKKRTGLIICAIIIISGIIPLIIFTYFADPAHPYTITETTLTADDYTKIQAHIYTPKNMSGNHPGIVMAHGFCGNSINQQLLAIELVKREFVVISINFRGHGSSGGWLPSFTDPNMVNVIEQDVVAAIRHLQSMGNINKIGLIGHSMGAMTSLKTADDYTNVVNATAVLGMTVGFEGELRDLFQGNLNFTLDYNLTRVRNLLICNSHLEQMFTADMTLDFLKLYTNRTDVELETPYGNFTNGTRAKAVLGMTEHLFEPMDPHIINETVAWFELAFYGVIRWDITLTSTFNTISFAITLIGIIAICFVTILYLHNYLWKDQKINLRKGMVPDTSLTKLIIYYVMASFFGTVFLLPGIFLFPEVTPISMGELLYAIPVGNAIGIIIMYYFIIRKTEKLGFRNIPTKIKAMCSGNYGRSILYGIVAAVLFAMAIASVAHWSTIITFPTAREVGAIFGMALLFFPWLLIKEFYFRTVQGQLNFSNRFKEYFTMVGIGFLMDAALFTPMMLLSWGNGFLFGFVALALTVVIVFSLIQQIIVTWVYMYSGRSILGSTVFLCIFYPWMMINFFPFGFPLF